jgi:non-specific serine/threonine protein kinase
LSTFIGRQQEFLELEELLSRTRLLTLVGPGGVGKTRVALRIGWHSANAEMSPAWSGIWLLDLAPVSAPELVAQELANALEVRQHSSTPLVPSLVRYLRDVRVLLILDNCDHLVSGCAELAYELLRSCPNLRMLCTSREPLGIDGEVIRRIEPLSLPPRDWPLRSAEQLTQSDAIRLFVDRAQSVAPEFALSSDTAPMVVRLCETLDGIPLALELAASRLRFSSIQQMLEGLVDASSLLNAGWRAGPARHRSLAAAFEWSFDMLMQTEQRLFESLSVFVGSWTLDAAEAVAANCDIAQPEVQNILCGLVDKSLVTTKQAGGGVTRYSFLETVREFAYRKLQAEGQPEVAHRTQVDYFIGLGEAAEPHLRGGPEFEAWIDRLKPEQGNFRSALQWCADHVDVERGLRLSGAVWRLWYLRGTIQEGRDWLGLVLQLARHSPHTQFLAKALNGAGVLAIAQEDYSVAQKLLEESRSIWTELGNAERIAACNHNLGAVAIARRDYVEAKRSYDRALAVARESGDKAGEVNSLTMLCRMYAEQGEFALARECATSYASIARETGDALNAAWAEIQIAWAELAEGNRVLARELFTRYLKFFSDRGPGPTHGVLDCLEGFAAIFAIEHKDLRALTLTASVANIRERLGYQGSSYEQRRIEHWLAPVRKRCSSRHVTETWTAGASMSLDDAIAYAGASARFNSHGDQMSLESNPLTPREREVAELIARGQSNREIAATLVIASSTTERHVANILNKLNVHSRHAIGMWVRNREAPARSCFRGSRSKQSSP